MRDPDTSAKTAGSVHNVVAGETWYAYSSPSDGQTRNAFLGTLRSVVDYRASRSARYYDLSVS